jgi:hypothetical protein
VRRDQSCTGTSILVRAMVTKVDVLVMPVMVPVASSPSVMMTPTAVVAHMTMTVPMSAPDLNNGTILRQRRDT